MNKKRDPKAYANESVIHTIKILEALEGTSFEPVSLKTIMNRTGLEYDKCRRVLLTLQLLNWTQQTEKKEWTLGTKILRFASRYNELAITALHRK